MIAARRGRPRKRDVLADDVVLFEASQHAAFGVDIGIDASLSEFAKAQHKALRDGNVQPIDWALLHTLLDKSQRSHERLTRLVERLRERGYTLTDALAYRMAARAPRTPLGIAEDELRRALSVWHSQRQVSA